MLSAPQETLELQVNNLQVIKLCKHYLSIICEVPIQFFLNFKSQQAKQSKPVAVTSLAFPTGDVNNFVVGSEDGAVYTACRYVINVKEKENFVQFIKRVSLLSP